MKFLSLFSGIGGFDLGLERAGMECAGQVEFNKFCIKVLEKHWPHVKRIGDIHDVKGNEFGPIDLICGGVPCQPASVAGKRKGTADDRWLWPEAFRIVEAIKPVWLLFENVSGILTLEDGLVFENLLSELESKDYEVQPFIIPACAVGAWHRRDRIWIVAHSKTERGKQSGDSRLWRSRLTDGINAWHSDVRRWNKREKRRIQKREKSPEPAGTNGITSDTRSIKSGGLSSIKRKTNSAIGKSSQNDTNPELNPELNRSQGNRQKRNSLGQNRLYGGENGIWQENWIEVATRLCRSNDGVSDRVHRLKALGNAVLPQIPEIFGKMIMEIEANQ